MHRRGRTGSPNGTTARAPGMVQLTDDYQRQMPTRCRCLRTFPQVVESPICMMAVIPDEGLAINASKRG